MKSFKISGREIGTDNPPYIIAELSGNHNGDLERALMLMEAAKSAGADAIKIQTYTADTMTLDHDSADFMITEGPWSGRNLYDLYREAHTPWEWHGALFNKGRELGITMFSTPFDTTSVDFLENFNVPAYKIASFEATDISLISYVASTGKPMIISTGMANLEEIEEALDAARTGGCKQLALLHCISGYPTPPEQSNLRTIVDMVERFGVTVGLSDHTLGTAVSVSAVPLGASIIEKHFTMLRADGGPDAAFSLEPAELSTLCNDCRTAWSAQGTASYERKSIEESSLVFRRSLYVVKDIKAGEALTNDNIRAIRPGYGLPPKYLSDVLGRMAAIDLPFGSALSWDKILS
ncbi:MAG: pseudaminic acid synthase [Rhodospirillales bacterium]|nr:pseudaminic acid synthase [Rhodospirillales bacterium]